MSVESVEWLMRLFVVIRKSRRGERMQTSGSILRQSSVPNAAKTGI
jgi:hypothetical protein